PDKLLCAPADFISSYLRGYFDGGTRFHLNRITATAACRELASDIVFLLSLFGIRGEITRSSAGFEVIINNKCDIDRFIKKIGFLNKHDFSGSRSASVSTGIDYEKLYNEYRLKTSALSLEASVFPDTITELMETLEKYREIFILLGMENKYETLKLLSKKDSRVMEVTEYAKYIGKDEVFNVIFVTEKQTWCANGIVVSGSIYNISQKSTSGQS
ncbi:hypothetical protein FXQ87_27700, partial [Salmonella enterica]|nr:hypothetical protein [Salmonella enterica]